MEFRAKQVLAPKDWGTFEDLCHTLFRTVWGDSLAQKNGRRGQPQSGVDIFGYRAGLLHGVQCKGRNGTYGSVATERDLVDELAKAETFRPELMRWIFATTSPSDVRLQELARRLTADRAARGKFGVDFLGWDEILQLLSENPKVAELYYPEHVLDVVGLIRRLEATPSPHRNQWAELDFRQQRDLGPALMGHALGPADAASCPTLVEAGLLTARLRTSFFVRLYGAPGSGKSICALQATLPLAQSGFNAKQLIDPSEGVLDLPEVAAPTVYFVDDAHLMPPGVLKLLERQAGPGRLLITTHNTSDLHGLPPSAVTLDERRAVRTIATALRADRPRTLAVVRTADDQVGDSIGLTPLERRLDDAESAMFPWQFCFVLGGGWRRTREASDKARAAGADLVLAAAALQQIASFDARSDEQSIMELCATEGLDANVTRSALDWLAGQRLLVSRDDCRTPHQRFAAVVLHRILSGRNHDDRAPIFRLVNRVLANPVYPLAGLSRLLEDYAFNPDNYSWARTVAREILLQLAERCWAATGDERGEAAHVIVQIDRYVDDWLDGFIRPRKLLISSWMSAPGRSGYGLSRLLNDIMNKNDEVLLSEIVSDIDPSSLAKALSATDDRTLFGCSELVDRIHRPSAEWHATFSASLDRDQLVAFSRSADTSRNAYLAVHAMSALTFLERELAIDMAQSFAPAAARHFRADPLEAYAELDELFTNVLRVMNVFGERSRKHGPTARESAVARSILESLEAKKVASALSAPSRHRFQTASYFLVCLRHCLPRKARAAVRALDWTRLGDAIGDAWTDMPHEIEAYLGILYDIGGRGAAPGALIAVNASRIELFPPRLALLAPEVAAQHVALGRKVSLVRHSHVDWSFGPVIIAYCGERHPHLVAPLLAPHLLGIASALSQQHFSYYERAAPMLQVLIKVAPHDLATILRLIDTAKAELGWANCLMKGGGPASAAAILVSASLGLEGPLADMGRRLRKRFPARSRTANSD